MENKIRQLDEQDNEGQGSGEVAIERREAKCALEELVCLMNQIDNQKSKVKWLRYIGILSGVLEHRRVECCSIDGESGVELEKPFFSKNGIKRAVFESDGEKVLGPDGFTLTFIKSVGIL